MKVYTFKSSPELIEALDALADELRTTRSELIRRAIAILLYRYARYGVRGLENTKVINVKRVVLS